MRCGARRADGRSFSRPGRGAPLLVNKKFLNRRKCTNCTKTGIQKILKIGVIHKPVPAFVQFDEPSFVQNDENDFCAFCTIEN
jgi:hypothetical protein